ncbi:hypothetical protein C1645_837431 [Glomus cerebriforme]|uniref:Uncharacterized protein n=1 Tax=Glomus cerebriforme TaxID=658196 RepID=A0A397S418_9GLOM|nr:hypothetical protein C1645_837431 [Glomus cerebriforme]
MEEFNELNFPETKQYFANLTELVFTTEERKDEIFTLLSQTCHNIQKMIIRVKYHNFIGCGAVINRKKNSTLEEAKQFYFILLKIFSKFTRIEIY